MSNPLKAILILVTVFLLVGFYESKRVETFSLGMENKFLRSFMLSFASASEKIKSSLGLAAFFERDENFWEEIKKSPKIFDLSQNTSQENLSNIPRLKIVENSENGLSSNPGLPLPAKIEPPYSILIAGDSFIVEGFGPAMEKELILYKDAAVYRKGLYSTGLSRPDYFNWEKEIKTLLESQNPNAVILTFGANDAQDQRTSERKIIRYGTNEWQEEYAKKVDALLDILEEKEISVFWVGLPITRKKSFSDKMAGLNAIYKNECQKYPHCVYISTWELLLNSEGKYTDYLPDETGKMQPVRRADGIHTKGFGSEILVKAVISKMREKMDLEKRQLEQ